MQISKLLYNISKKLSYSLLSYLDIPVSFIEDHFDKLRVLQSIQKVGIETVKVRLNADTLHHQVLRHPWHKLILHSLLQLLNLKKANVVSESGFFNNCCLWDSYIFFCSTLPSVSCWTETGC